MTRELSSPVEYESKVMPFDGSLTDHTARGFAFSVIQTIVTKLAGIAAQIVLAWLLTRADFGVAGLALMIAAFVNLLRDTAVNQILLVRQKAFRHWVNAAFWMSISLGIVCGVALILIAPFAAKIFREGELRPLLIVLGIGSPLFALSIVPTVRLQIELRFRYLAITGSIFAILTSLLSIILAYHHFGAFSIVAPIVAAAFVRGIVYLFAARIPVRVSPQLHRWRYLLGHVGVLFFASVCLCFTSQGDYLILGLKHNADVVGIYYFAFGLSIQTISLTNAALTMVLTPVLTKMRADRVQQTRAYIRALKLMALAGVPICLLQAALAAPAIRLIFQPKWYPAIPVVQVLSAIMAIHLIGGGAHVLTAAQGRFKTYARFAAAFAILFFICVWIGATIGAALAVAVGVAICFFIADLVNFHIAIQPGGGSWRDILAVYGAPVVLGILAIAPGMLIAATMPVNRIGDALRILILTALAVAIYLPMIRKAMPESWAELMFLLRRLRG